MPVFGEYETLGRPLFMSGRQGQIRTYWIARRGGEEDGRVYFIKAVALPSRESSQRPVADFFEGVTRLQEACRAAPELLAPIYSSGQTDTEVWYATDWYPRRSFIEFESSSNDLKNAALGHVVYSVARACLALQRATGRCHGNLKPGNVLLAGEPGPLRLTPLRLIDAAGSTSRQPSAADLEADATPATCDTAEPRDLLGIGQMILQLVESNPIEGPEDYSLPIEASTPWRVLGKHSQRWLDLCNRLLDPELSLDEISLESLAEDFKPPPRLHRSTAVLAGLGLMLVAGLASYPMWRQGLRRGSEPALRETERAASAQGPVSSISLAEGTTARRAPSRLNTKDTAASPITDKARGLPSAIDMPSTSGRVAAVPANADAAIEAIDPPTQTIDPGRAKVAAVTPTIEPAGFAVTAQAPDSGAPAGSATGRFNSEPPQTESTAQTTVRKTTPVDSATPPVVSNPQELGSAPPETRSTADTNVSRPTRVDSAPPPARTQSQPQRIGPSARELGQSIVSEPMPVDLANAPVLSNPRRNGSAPRDTRSTAQESRTSVPSPPVAIADLDRQLRQLEARVASAVAVRRNYELFAQVDSIEAQYAKARHLSGRRQMRLDLLRSNMIKKMLGPPPGRPLPQP
jgi:hypothetical protein